MSLFISAASRRRFDLPDDLVSTDGKGRLSLRIDSPADARSIAHHLAARAGDTSVEADAATSTSAGQLNALAVLCDILKVTLERSLGADPGLLKRLLGGLDRDLGKESVDAILALVATGFPAEERQPEGPVEAGKSRRRESSAGGEPDRVGRLADLLLLHVARLNTPPGPLLELLGGDQLAASPDYPQLVMTLLSSLELVTAQGSPGRSLLPMLRSPLLAEAGDGGWAAALAAAAAGDLPPALGRRAQTAAEILIEEEMPRFPPGPGPLELPRFDEQGEDRYAEDRPWMPEVVLVAKNVRVWLAQLSRSYDRRIDRLDQIPDEELKRLQGWGLTGLWLIGLWERSPASQQIKRLCGNPEAGASAYAIRAYRVAESLGGEAALVGLRQRAGDLGIRIAADMVANHLAIDSDWMIEHPERFLSLPRPPFPGYSFSGPDLSSDPRCAVHLEEHYYDRSDAAVVFQRVDRESGEARFIYHGNDGTSVPWNDTAQLDYLNATTREAVILTILEVAKQVSVLRFDAAMTLTRRHYQRLWTPAPGDSGAIPSRAEFGMDTESFARLMPEEFWREVVERLEREAPDTLLLAEAFWLTESFFVRHLGMHRVYNSAFMHTLRDGENAKFRQLVASMLSYDPRLLERQVNFLSNPDERTAIDQFGSGDRYFGACVLLATLPGMPMFGHGQIEGLGERYGMEYERDYHDEAPDPEIVARHEREIVPLLRYRRLFAGSENFRLFALETEGGGVDDDLLAYSNHGAGERSLVLFNNRSTGCHGVLRRSSEVARPGAQEGATSLSTETLAGALSLTAAAGAFVAWRDLISGKEFVRRFEEISTVGFEVRLPAFGAAVMTSFRQLDDDPQGALSRLTEALDGAGVDDLVAARLRLEQEPLRPVFERLVGVGASRRPVAVDEERPAAVAALRTELLDLAEEFLDALDKTAPGNVSVSSGLAALGAALDALAAHDPALRQRGARSRRRSSGRQVNVDREESRRRSKLWAWALMEMLAVSGPGGGALPTAIWDPRDALHAMLEKVLGGPRSQHLLAALEIAVRHDWSRFRTSADDGQPRPLREWLSEPDIGGFVDLRRRAGVEELNLQSLLDLVDLRLLLRAVGDAAGKAGPGPIRTIWQHRRHALSRLG